MTRDQIDALATRLFAAIERRDIESVDACYASDIEVWHSPTRETQTREESLRLLGWLAKRCTEWRYQEVRREIFEDGFVQQHVLHTRNALGAAVEIPVCLVARVRDDRIVRIEEYLDGAASEPLFEQ